MRDLSTGVLLSVERLSKSYATPVLRRVNFDLREGEVHALVGANGAGKSTLARIICGLTAKDQGQMRLAGQVYDPQTKRSAEGQGIHMVMQELNLIGVLSVAENLFLNRLPHRAGFIAYCQLLKSARRALADVGLEHIDPLTPLHKMGVGQQQLVEIAAALSQKCRVLILDEPTAALTSPQIDLLFKHVKRLKQAGVGIIYISHRMEEIRQIADRVTILRDGQVIDTRPTAEISLQEIIGLMVGCNKVEQLDLGERRFGDVAMRVDKLCCGELVRNVSFELRKGEILGFAGLIGSGRTETLRAIFGADPIEGGEIQLGAKSIKIRRPRDAVRAGLGMIPEDRKQHGLLTSKSIRHNISLARLSAVSRLKAWLSFDKEAALAEQYSSTLQIQCASNEQVTSALSGGNQQKVVLARWLLRNCEVLMFDEPTRGIDVAAKAAIYQHLGDLARSGKAIIVVSSDLDELIAIADRIAVMSAGRLVKIFTRGAWRQEEILSAAFSAYLKQDKE
jgi:ribose transport system ATP-binding protein